VYFIAPDSNIYDDGHGMTTWPAYGVDEYDRRYELDATDAAALTQQWKTDSNLRDSGSRSRFPIGDAVARVTKAVGIAACVPCQQRQATLNKFGDRLAGYWNGDRRR